jgi:uncharacterized membrane protein
MIKYFRVGLPVVVLISIIFNFVLSVHSNNETAATAYVTAFFGWVVIVVDEVLHYRREYMNKDTV